MLFTSTKIGTPDARHIKKAQTKLMTRNIMGNNGPIEVSHLKRC